MLRLTIRDARAGVFDEHDVTRVHTWHDVSGAACAYGYVGARVGWVRWPGLVVFRFDEDGLFEAFPERHVDPALIRDIGYRTVQPLVLQALGWETLHASSIVIAGGVVAFCGDRQTGKSTLAYALSRRGYRQHSDDTVVLQVGGSGVLAVDLPFGVRLRADPAAFFGFGPTVGHFHDLSRVDHDRSAATTEPLGAVCVLRRTNVAAPRMERLGPGAALAAVMEHAYCFDPTDARVRQRVLDHYLDVVASIPVYELRFSTGLEHVNTVLDCVEETFAKAELV